MKKNFIKISTLFIAIFIAQIAVAQEHKEGELYPGYVVIKKDTIRGHIILLNKLASQNKVIFIGDLVQKVTSRKEYGPGNITGYSVAGNYYESIPYSDKNNPNPTNFALRRKSGQMSVYDWYAFGSHVENQKSYDPQKPLAEKVLQKHVLLRKGRQPIVSTGDLGFFNFKNAMSDFVKDNKELAQKVSKQVYKRDDIEKIADEYNEWYSTKRRR